MNPIYIDMKEVSEYLDILKFAKKTETDIPKELLMKFLSLREHQGKIETDKICFEE